MKIRESQIVLTASGSMNELPR